MWKTKEKKQIEETKVLKKWFFPKKRKTILAETLEEAEKILKES